MLAPPQEECFTNIVQDFLICTTVHKARQLGVFQGETLVRITLDKSHRQTKSYSNSENPYFNEYFVFEIHSTLMELLRLTILYEVKKRTTCKKNPTLGELLIDMQSVWSQPNRCYFKKWGRLEVPIGQDTTTDTMAGRGFIQIDLAIVSQASNPNTLLRPYEEDIMSMNKWQINQDYDDIQKFHPFKGKTNVAKATQQPIWNQQISFAWTYPSLAQTFLVQLLVYEHLQWKCAAEYELHFDEIAFKDKPAMGPTYIHLYDNLSGSHYVGRILMEIRSECLDADPVREIRITNVPQLDEKRYWVEEHFLVEFLALQGDFLHACNASNCKISVRLAEHQSNFIECYLKSYEFKKNQNLSFNLKCFRNETPYKAITLRVYLPDNRIKYTSDIFLQELVDFVKYEIEAFKMFQIQYALQYQSQVKVLRAIIMTVINRIKTANENKCFEHTGFRDPTTWDMNRLIFLKDYFNKLHDDLRKLRGRLKPSKDTYIDLVIEDVLHELTVQAYHLQNLLAITRIQDEWPDLLLIMTAGIKETGVCRLNAKNFLHPPQGNDQSPNSQCWKDIQCQHTCAYCGCVVGIVQGCLSIVGETERADFFASVSQDWKRPEPFYWNPTVYYTYFKCRIFIHQAKVRPGGDRTGLCDPYIRVMICMNSAETAVIYETLSPIWNSVISFDNILMPGCLQWYVHNPPLVAIELYDTDKKTSDDYLGCGYLPVSVISSDWADSNTREEGDANPCVRGTDFGKIVHHKPALQKFQYMRLLSPPPLKWVPVSVSGGTRAEVLMSGELVELQNQRDMPTTVESCVTVGIPTPIRPIMKNFVLEVVFAGFRNYRKGSSNTASRHRVKVMMADLMLSSGLSMSRIKQSINFLVLHSSGIVSLPDQLEYWPAIIGTDVSVSSRGAETTLGAVIISDSKRFLQRVKEIKCGKNGEGDGETSIASTTVHMGDDEISETAPLINSRRRKLSPWKRIKSLTFFKRLQPKGEEAFNMEEVLNENSYNWWTKFYNSGIVEHCGALSSYKHRLCVYQNELEKQSEFSYLIDWAEPLLMVHGVKYKKNAMPKEEVYATLKLNIKITPCQCGQMDGGDGSMLKPLATVLNPRYQAQIQALAELVKVIVRVYIVQGIQFRPREKSAQADSYVKIQFGQRNITNRAHYVPNESNPIFGKCFQLEGLLPREHILEVSVFNRNNIRDEAIGSTFIDLEDRWRTKHRGTVGIANEYSSFGYNKWRDFAKPSEILNELCLKHSVNPPRIVGNIIEIDGVELEDDTCISLKEDLVERLSLTALKNLEKLPSFGYKLVPEHVETRPLYCYDRPGIEQGKIQLWVELFDANLNIPAPIDFTPQPPLMYELRVIVYQCADVILDDKNIFGKAMSDIFVKGWCSNTDEYQSTDVHYRSMNGEGKFNWRMIFPLKYSIVEDMIVIKRRTGILEEFEIKQPPKLFIHIFDKDLISDDDFLGALEINLSHFPEPYASSKTCALAEEDYGKRSLFQKNKVNEDKRKLLNLFRQKKIRGWFPMKGHDPEPAEISAQRLKSGKMTGKIELELEIATEAEAASYPVGLGRSPPHALPEPMYINNFEMKQRFDHK
uniref:C2 domain-containing protein n=1 Tax=Glossina morsitans morsitans TaxID=37546 RepID=A0A1B0G2Q0_GLOMM